jgi:hypothetical protein
MGAEVGEEWSSRGKSPQNGIGDVTTIDVGKTLFRRQIQRNTLFESYNLTKTLSYLTDNLFKRSMKVLLTEKLVK